MTRAEGASGEGDLAVLARRFAAAVERRDRAEAKACCTRSGTLPGETPAALYLDAVDRAYRLEVAGAARSNGERGAVPVRILKEGHPPREVWLLAEPEEGRVGLAGVTGSPKTAAAFLAGWVPADARLKTLPESERARALGTRLVEAHARHGKVSEVLGRTPVAAMAAGLMLDRLLASPGATLTVTEARELPAIGRAALGFEVHRPELSLPEGFWLVLELGAEAPIVRATASSMSLDVLLHEVTPEVVGRSSIVEKLEDRGTAPAKLDPLEVIEHLDRVDRIEALLESLRAKVEGPPEVEAPRGGQSPRPLLDDETRARLQHDPAAAEAVRALLERLVAGLPSVPAGETLADQLRGLLGELLEGLRRTLDQHRAPP